jgi:hypothetical protein
VGWSVFSYKNNFRHQWSVWFLKKTFLCSIFWEKTCKNFKKFQNGGGGSEIFKIFPVSAAAAQPISLHLYLQERKNLVFSYRLFFVAYGGVDDIPKSGILFHFKQKCITPHKIKQKWFLKSHTSIPWTRLPKEKPITTQ